MSGPGYTTAEYVFYACLILGMLATYLLLERAGMERGILLFLLSLVVGCGVGWLGELLYRSGGKKPPPNRDDSGDRGPRPPLP